MKGAVATPTNYGTISGSRALDIRAGGHVINAASGSIAGTIQGVLFTTVAGTLTNFGRVTATATDGTGIYRWTDGHAALPSHALACFTGAVAIEVQTGPTELHYPIDGRREAPKRRESAR